MTKTRSSLEVPRQEASPFRSCCVCASLLKATLFSCVCTQIRLLPLTLCSQADVFEPSWPLACNIKLVYFIYRVVVLLPYRESLISVVYPACMITVHGLILRASHPLSVLSIGSSQVHYTKHFYNSLRKLFDIKDRSARCHRQVVTNVVCSNTVGQHAQCGSDLLFGAMSK